MNWNKIENFFATHRATILISIISGAFGAVFISLFIAGLSAANYGRLTRLFLFDELSPARQSEENSLRSLLQHTFGASEESRIISVANAASPAVVSISITKTVPTRSRIGRDDQFDQFLREFFGYEIPSRPAPQGGVRREVGGGSGFLVSPDGMIVTNKHVVEDKNAEYTVFTNDGKKYAASVVATDPRLDIAILKIDGSNFPYLTFGDSDMLQPGQTAIAIGNALAEFQNTVSVGVVSGLARSVVAGDMLGNSEYLEGVIQTDAAINPGNSGGPLLDLSGQVIGVNVAVVSGSQSIGFAIPSNGVKSAVESVKKHGRVIRPFIGVRYAIITEELKNQYKLSVDYGAYILPAEVGEDPSIVPGSPAAKAGLREGDIILEVTGTKVIEGAGLGTLIAKHSPGDTITLLVLRGDKKISVNVTLAEQPNN